MDTSSFLEVFVGFVGVVFSIWVVLSERLGRSVFPKKELMIFPTILFTLGLYLMYLIQSYSGGDSAELKNVSTLITYTSFPLFFCLIMGDVEPDKDKPFQKCLIMGIWCSAIHLVLGFMGSEIDLLRNTLFPGKDGMLERVGILFSFGLISGSSYMLFIGFLRSRFGEKFTLLQRMPRVSYTSKVNFDAKDILLHGQMIDISIGGCKVATEKGFPIPHIGNKGTIEIDPHKVTAGERHVATLIRVVGKENENNVILQMEPST